MLKRYRLVRIEGIIQYGSSELGEHGW